MKTSFINNILISQLILIKFAIKLLVCKMSIFSDTYNFQCAFPLKQTYFKPKGDLQVMW